MEFYSKDRCHAHADMHVRNLYGPGWIVSLTKRLPKCGERGARLYPSSPDAMLHELVDSLLDERGYVRPRFMGPSRELRLGHLFTHSPRNHVVCRADFNCYVTIEIVLERDTARAALQRQERIKFLIAEARTVSRWQRRLEMENK